MDKAAAVNGLSIVQGLIERIENEAGVGGRGDPPADDPPRKGVDDEGDIDEARPGGDIGKVADPQRVRARRLELALHMVERTRRRAVADRRLDALAPHDALQAHAAHQASDRAAGDVVAFPVATAHHTLRTP